MESTIEIANIGRIRTDTDGEGVTTLVVSMGCPLRCAYCLNPFTWDGTKIKTLKMSVDELYNELKIDHLYFISTGGGIVFGGGEPLLNSSFLEEFILKYRNTGWKFSLETSLNVNRENLNDVLNLVDKYIIDVKDMNKARYEAYTKADYDRFYENLIYLKDKVDQDKILIKVPKIYGFHKNDEWKESIRVLKELGFKNIALFEYIDVSKHKQISDMAIKNRDEFVEKYIN